MFSTPQWNSRSALLCLLTQKSIGFLKRQVFIISFLFDFVWKTKATYSFKFAFICESGKYSQLQRREEWGLWGQQRNPGGMWCGLLGEFRHHTVFNFSVSKFLFSQIWQIMYFNKWRKRLDGWTDPAYGIEESVPEPRLLQTEWSRQTVTNMQGALWSFPETLQNATWPLASERGENRAYFLWEWKNPNTESYYYLTSTKFTPTYVGLFKMLKNQVGKWARGYPSS